MFVGFKFRALLLVDFHVFESHYEPCVSCFPLHHVFFTYEYNPCFFIFSLVELSPVDNAHR